VVSTALVVERAEEGHAYPVQHPVYFISEVLGPSKKKYPQVQKLLYAVLLTARKLRHYFDDHKVIVVTGFPIGDILHNKEAIGRIAKWACQNGLPSKLKCWLTSCQNGLNNKYQITQRLQKYGECILMAR
jgi:hypothetical protein